MNPAQPTSLVSIPSNPPSITLFDLKDDLAAEWVALIDRTLPMVYVYHGDFSDIEASAIVSPANSFGFMDGGIDLAYSNYFGSELQRILQMKIQRKHHGELLVGQAEIIPTNNRKFPYLIAAPTMRVPMVLGTETVNPYLAMRAVMHLWLHGKIDGKSVRSVVNSIAVPGFGTAIGRVPARVCAHQQIRAIREALVAPAPYPEGWHDAQIQHQLLYTNRPFDLQQVEPAPFVLARSP